MDTAAVRGLLVASLVPDADNRRRAELQLKQVRAESLFPTLLRHFIYPPLLQPQHGV